MTVTGSEVRLRVHFAWMADDHLVLPSLRSLFSYDEERSSDRATGWVYSAGHERLPAMNWPEPLTYAGPRMIEYLERDTGVRFTAACYQAYRNGAGVSWHHDRDWDAQAVISLGATRKFGIRDAGGHESFIELAHGDMVFMPSGFQHEWEHCVPEEDVTGERVSLVFRSAVSV